MSENVSENYQTILFRQEGAVATITFNRPEKRNALTIEVYLELLDALRRVERNDDTKVLVLAGAGPAFCAGRDFAEARAADAKSATYYLQLSFEARDLIRRFPKPVIARVHGPASGGGCTIATDCSDITIASYSARFSLREVQAGSLPNLNVFTIGRARALGMLLTGDWISGEQAEKWGLVYAAVPDDQLDATVARIAAQLSNQSNLAMAYTKKSINYLLDLAGHTQVEQYLAECRTLVQQGQGRAAALDSFLDKSRR